MKLPRSTSRGLVCILKIFVLVAALWLSACTKPAKQTSEEVSEKVTDIPVATDKFAEDNRAHGRWRSASLGGGGYSQNVVFCPSKPDRLYTYVDVGGIYRSDDAGKTWRMMHGGLPVGDGYQCVRGMAVDPVDADRIVIGVGNQWTGNRGVFISTDGGIAWKKVLDVPFLGNEQHRSKGFVFAQTPKGELLAGSAGAGLWKSTDRGETWAIDGLEGVNITDIKLAQSGVIYVCAKPHSLPDRKKLKGGFFSKAPGGEWVELADGPEEIIIGQDGSLTGIFESREVRSSRDGGGTWESDSKGLPIDFEKAKGHTSENRFRALAAGPGFQLVGSSRGTVYRRAGIEQLWQKVEREGVEEVFEGRLWWGRILPGKWQHFGACMGTLAISPTDPNTWWMTDWYGIYETKDAGKNWILRIDGIEITVIHCFLQDPTHPGLVHSGMADNGYISSTNGGMRFEGGRKFLSNMKALALDPSLPGRLYGAGDSGSGQWRAGYLWVSANGGENWVRSPMRGVPEQQERAMNSLSVRPGHPYEVVIGVSGPVGQGGGVFRSLDGGLTFEPLNEGLTTGEDYFHKDIWGLVAELTYGPDGTLVATSRRSGAIHRLPLGETAWQKVGSELPGTSHQLRANGEYFFLTRSAAGLWRSRDGVDWQQVYGGPCEALAVDTAVAGRLAVSTNGKVSISTDSGATWQDAGSPPFGQISALGFAGERLLVGTRGGGFFLTPLSVAGSETIKAGPLKNGLLPVLEEAETTLPTGKNRWSRLWTSKGTLESIPATEGLGIIIKSIGGSAAGSSGWIFDTTGMEFELRGNWRVEGPEGTIAKLALRSLGEGNEQIGWSPLAEIKAGGEEKAINIVCSLAPEALRGEIILLFEGDGSVNLRNMSFGRANSIFGTPLPTTAQSPQ